jgi:hypothetical protein
MDKIWYVVIGIVGTGLVGLLIRIADFMIRDAHFEVMSRKMAFLGNEIRFELSAENKTGSLKELLDLQIVYVLEKKAYVYAELSVAPISKRPDSLTDVGLDQQKRYFLSFQPHTSNTLVLSFNPVDGPLPKNAPVYLSAIDAKGHYVYALVNLKTSEVQKMDFKRKRFSRN